MKKAYLIIVTVITMFAAIMCMVANNVVLNDAFQKALGFSDDGEGNFALFLCIPLYVGQFIFNLSAVIAAARVIPVPEKGVRVAGAMIIIMNVTMILFSATVLIISLKTGNLVFPKLNDN